MRATHEARRRCVHNAGRLARNTPLSAFSPRWSALWAPRHPEPRPHRSRPRPHHREPRLTATKRGDFGIRGATRRRHADRMLLMVQNPHHYPWGHAPARVERHRSGGIFPMGRILSEERRCEQASLTTPPSTTPGTEPRPTRYAHNRRPVCARSGLLPPRRPGEGAPASLRGLRKRRAARLCPGLECSRGGRSR